MKTLIIDNYDSMTFNLFQAIGEVNGQEPIVLRNDALDWSDIRSLDVDNVVISPGPGRPEQAADFGVSAAVIRQAEVPILGVCLGHQGIGHLFGARIRHAPEPMHGRCSRIIHTGEDLFKGIPSPFCVARYHSLIIAGELPAELEQQAWTADGLVMAIRCRSRPIWGVQFHPESIGTEYGQQLLANFRRLTERRLRKSRRAEPAPSRFAQVPAFRPVAQRSRPQTRFVLHARRLDLWVDPERVFAAEFGRARHAFWLDSSRIMPGLARFSFMGDAAGPHAEIITYRCADRVLRVRCGDAVSVHQESVLDYLRRQLQSRIVVEHEPLPFDLAGGYVGWFGYELKQECGATPRHTAPTPDAAFVFADRLIAFDHQERAIWLVQITPPGGDLEATAWSDGLAIRLSGALPEAPWFEGGTRGPVVFRLRHDRDAYLEKIRHCLKEIRNGESYEICLTNQVTTEARIDPLRLYRILRAINPAPYAAFLRFSGLAVLCSSPERFLKIDRNRVLEAKPIKGTIRRGRSEAEDRLLRETLRCSEKDRAENLMIVDLLRNDLGLVSELGSVTVPKLMDVESYATVHQMVSTIRGRLHPDLSPIDAVRAAFPGGSMTGAPKHRTLEIIDRLEQGPRGVYSGAIGFLGLDGTVDLNVVIRTIVADGDRLSIGCGGAITALSDPDAEFDEMLLKARAPMRAIALAVTGDQERYALAGEEVASALP